MKFHAGGPDIPLKLINALEEDKLVFFCGAGVSSQIPEKAFGSFSGLATLIAKELNYQKPLPKEKSGEIDIKRTFHKFETEFDKADLDSCIRRVLTLNRATSKQLRQHKALLRLSYSLNRPKPRLVTTNFDNCFELAWRSLGLKKQYYMEHCANALPTPDSNWRSVVHLHGKANNEESELIYSGKGFAKAYLGHQWAANFLRVLFQEYTVAFIGYSVNDPIMEYAVQAVRENDKPYIFIKNGSLNEVLDHALEPISYNSHDLLWTTIEHWSSMHEQGRDGWVNYAQRELAQNYPVGLNWSLEDSTSVKNLTQILANKDNAQRLLSSSSLPINWLDIFRKADGAYQESLEKGSASEDFNVLQPDVHYGRIANHLKDSRRLHPVTMAIGAWLTRYMSTYDKLSGKYPVLDFVIESGGILHQDIFRLLKEQFEKMPSEKSTEKENPALLQAWEITLFHATPTPSFHYDFHDYKDMDLSNNFLVMSLTQRLINSLKPRLSIKKPSSYSTGSDERIDRLSDLLEIKIKLSCYYGAIALKTDGSGIFKTIKDSYPDILISLFDPIEGHLREVVRLSNLFQDEDMLNFLQIMKNRSSSIGNQTNADWTLLIDWLWAGFDRLGTETKRRKIEQWSNDTSLLFRRLALKGYNQMQKEGKE